MVTNEVGPPETAACVPCTHVAASHMGGSNTVAETTWQDGIRRAKIWKQRVPSPETGRHLGGAGQG